MAASHGASNRYCSKCNVDYLALNCLVYTTKLSILSVIHVYIQQWEINRAAVHRPIEYDRSRTCPDSGEFYGPDRLALLETAPRD